MKRVQQQSAGTVVRTHANTLDLHASACRCSTSEIGISAAELTDALIRMREACPSVADVIKSLDQRKR